MMSSGTRSQEDMLSPAAQTADSERFWKRLARIDQLPTLPLIVQRLRDAVENPASDARTIADLIENDPAIMARMMKVVNSAFYRGFGEITSLQDAVVRLGMHTVFNIAVSTSVFSTFPPREGVEFNRFAFWKHSIQVAVGTEVLSSHLGVQDRKNLRRDVLHLTGLLHDMGKIIFEQYFHDEFTEALLLSRQQNMPLHRAERQVIGADHGAVGAWLGEHWQLPAEVWHAIRWHHAPEQTQSTPYTLLGLTAASNEIVNFGGLSSGGDIKPGTVSNSERLGLNEEDCLALAEAIGSAAEKSFLMQELLDE